MEQPPRTQWDAGHGGRCRSNREEVARTFSTLMAETWLAARCIGLLEDPPERSRRAPPHVWRGRPRPRKEPFGWRSHFGNRFVGHVHSSLTRNSAPTHSGIGDGGRGRPPHAFHVHQRSALTKYRYRRRLPHLQKADAAMFVTFCTGGHLAF